MRHLPLTLPPGSDLRLSIEAVGKREMREGYILGVVGNLSKAVFQCPGRSGPIVLEGNLEIITLNGTVSPTGVHLHLSLSDGDCQVWGGHLEEGTLVLKGAEVLVGILDADHSESSEIVSKSMQHPRLEIAVMPSCPWSARALRILSANNVPHIIKNIDNDEAFNSFRERSGRSTFPQVFIDGELLGGYESLAELQRKGRLSDLR